MTTSVRVCAQCGATAPDGTRFCGQCASPLSDTTSAPAAQGRRQATVFFSDLSGFTALNERLDPEDMRDVVNKVWERAGEIVSTPEDIAKNPQLQHRRWLTPVEHPELNATLEYPGPPYRFSETPWAIRRPPPTVGEHTEEVLNEVGSQSRRYEPW